jgi:YesN/AraC family two-component response regulator
VELAENGREGFEKFAAGTFDLVLTDRSMPELSGDQLALEIKRIRPATPVVLLTGFGDLMVAEGEMPPGVDLIISKPFNQASLREGLTRAFAMCG